ncbi:MAG: ATP-dependent endonuclease [Confluentimicrobium sp.]|uniref:ATP-dependent nuclease n=1 Tax=Actibacterium sp. TaxID=1872125 RepID=UPI000C5F802E|nr:AAA family ATPase [Actibacterium sp.]MBC55306.1 ATP-dependent endonuclease [Actibacterium sp.]
MAVIRKVEISHFRSIKSLEWYPTPGINCLIGSGDSGKSTVLDAIDLCLGARRSIPITDADFHMIDVETPISVTLTLGDLSDSLRNYEAYGDYLRGYEDLLGTIEDEPGNGLETVLSLNLEIAGDLEPRWRLRSDRADAKGSERNLNWKDRLNLAPTRLGATSDHNLAWRRGSVLGRLSEETPDASLALSQAAREARKAFGNDADAQLGDALASVKKAADELGIPIGAKAQALLDTHSVSMTGGSIALHDENGVPLRGLGLGSTRLLIAGLQREVAAVSSILLVDEVENGLEPHRIIRLLGSLGAKEQVPPQQVFATTHSPIVLRELAARQLRVLRKSEDRHVVRLVADTAQGTLRSAPEAFLAPSVLVCEGASEIGFVRGFEQHCAANGRPSIFACGVALVDGGGGHPDRLYQKATEFVKLGYRAGVFRDADLVPNAQIEAAFHQAAGVTFTWHAGQSLEAAIIGNIGDATLLVLLDYAIAEHGQEMVAAHVQSASANQESIENLRAILHSPQQIISPAQRDIIVAACTTKRNPWFKTIGRMEYVARNVLAPNFGNVSEDFQNRVNALLAWAQTLHG